MAPHCLQHQILFLIVPKPSLHGTAPTPASCFPYQARTLPVHELNPACRSFLSFAPHNVLNIVNYLPIKCSKYHLKSGFSACLKKVENLATLNSFYVIESIGSQPSQMGTVLSPGEFRTWGGVFLVVKMMKGGTLISNSPLHICIKDLFLITCA